MKIIVLANQNKSTIAPFIQEQIDALIDLGIDITLMGLKGKGVIGYLKNNRNIQQIKKNTNPDLIHAHYGLIGLLANLQRNIPVITTYHGSDINNTRVYKFSMISILLSAYNIFVSEKIRTIANVKKNNSVIPCGINLQNFYPMEKNDAKRVLNLNMNKDLILFAGSFDNKVKNPKLAHEAIDLLNNTKLIELKGFNRSQVAVLLNAVDVLLMTSISEGSPQIIKEAMACNTPIVSVDVGDVSQVIGSTEGCYIAKKDKNDIEKKLRMALAFAKSTGKTRGRDIAVKYDNKLIAKELVNIYQIVYASRKK